DAGNLNSILRMRRAEHNRRRSAIENSIASTQDRLLVDRIAEAHTRREVIAVAYLSDGAETGSRQRRTWIVHGGIGKLLVVVAQTKIQGQPRIDAPVVLHKESIVLHVRKRRASGGARAWEVLGVRRRRV